MPHSFVDDPKIQSVAFKEYKARAVSITTPIQDLITEITRDTQEAFYIIDLSQVVRQYQHWIDELPRVTPFYAVKCNPSPPIVKLVAQMGGSFDCASEKEIEQILALGVNPKKIIFANPCKMMRHIKYAYENGVEMTTFDNEDELYKLKEAWPNVKAVLRIAVDDSQSICKFNSKFGAAPNETLTLIQLAKRLGINLHGVSFHVGSGCGSVDSFVEALYDAKKVFDQAKNEGIDLKLLDIGGGFPGSDDVKPSFDEITKAMRPVIDELFDENNVEIIGEPGRYMVCSSHTLVCNIYSTRETVFADGSSGFRYYINDGVYHSFNCIFFDHVIPKIEVLKDYNKFTNQINYKNNNENNNNNNNDSCNTNVNSQATKGEQNISINQNNNDSDISKQIDEFILIPKYTINESHDVHQIEFEVGSCYFYAAHASMQGRRPTMEDDFTLEKDITTFNESKFKLADTTIVLTTTTTETEVKIPSATEEAKTTATATEETKTTATATEEIKTTSTATEETETTTTATEEAKTATTATEEAKTATTATEEAKTATTATEEAKTATTATEEAKTTTNATEEAKTATTATEETKTTTNATEETKTTTNATEETKTTATATEEAKTTTNATDEQSESNKQNEIISDNNIVTGNEASNSESSKNDISQNKITKCAMVGVFDGHGGKVAASYVSDNLKIYVASNIDQIYTNPEQTLKTLVKKFDEDFIEYAKANEFQDGTTLVFVLIFEDKYVIANVGDSEAVLCRGEEIVNLTEIHNPARNPEEKKRILDLNGKIVQNRLGHPRFNAQYFNIAVSRAIGDIFYKDEKFVQDKKSGLIPEPFVKSIEKDKNDKFFIIACDGLWDVFNHQQAVEFVNNKIKDNVSTDDIAKLLMHEAYKKNSQDNITVSIVQIQHY
eukprot:TRINITY_DN58_c0_g3_i7.p1 TRINITY_DN58_c0_g3~~TRINITY_DN58_c0_g3_i7.p1  ORF type:complete len:931 (-),score=463.32 TRINITY_DN58_c0_g3_i7:131-2833(-)